jgi:hypothetical protein
MMMEGSGAGSVLVTIGSGCGSGRLKNIRIRIAKTGRNTLKVGTAIIGVLRRSLEILYIET